MESSASATGPDSGVLLVDKPATWTSHDVVSYVRRFGFRKVGHCGTLDPAATGLLVIVVGRATKLSAGLSGQEKTYAGIMQLGVTTDSQDADGKVIETRDWSAVSDDRVRQVCAGFVGELQQIPPMVSAVKKDGVKLYELARRGETIEREPRAIVVHRFDLDQIALPDVHFTVHCSKGVYVRTLCHDIGAALGCGAHLRALRRLASGRFRIEDAHPMDQVKLWSRDDVRQRLLPLETALSYVD